MAKKKPANKSVEHRTPDELLRHLQEKSDDIDAVTIGVTGYVETTERIVTGAGAAIHYCDGHIGVISVSDAERLINDGVLSRMKIRVKLVDASMERGS